MTIEPQYKRRAGGWHMWAEAGSGYIVHATPRIMDDFGNSVRIRPRQISWAARQSHDCSILLGVDYY